MKLFFNHVLTLFFVLSSFQYVCGMELDAQDPYFPHAWRSATERRNFAELKQCIIRPDIMNKLCMYTGMFPLAAIINRQFDTNLVITALLHGSRTDFNDSQRRSLFHYIADRYRLFIDKDPVYFPKKNLLAALAIPTHTNSSLNNADQSKLRIKTTLLLLNRLGQNLNAGTIKYCILGHLEEDIYNAGLLALVLSQRQKLELYIGKYPFAWIQMAFKGMTGDDRSLHVEKYACALARYRLKKVLPLLAKKDINLRTAYQTAQNNARWTRELNVNSPASIKDSHDIAQYFNPRGFVRRHLPECTKIIANLLQDKEPFDGFKPF